MIDMKSQDNDSRAVAHAYIEQREHGALADFAFTAAVGAYRKRHPESNNCEAALAVDNLMQEMPRTGCL